MERVIDAFVAVIMILVAFMVVAVIAGADPSTVTGLFSSIFELLVYVFILAVFAAIVIGLASEGGD